MAAAKVNKKILAMFFFLHYIPCINPQIIYLLIITLQEGEKCSFLSSRTQECLWPHMQQQN